MKIKEVSALTGLPESTIRYYEEEGLISPAKELMNGRYYRSYTEGDAAQLKALGTLRRARFTIEEILAMGASPEKIPEICADCGKRLRAEGRELLRIGAAIDKLSGDRMRALSDLAEAISPEAEKAQLPARDVQVNFGRFDEGLCDEPPAGDANAFRAAQDNRRLTEIMQSHPSQYVYSTGLYTSTSPSRRLAMDEFEKARDSGYESAYPAFMYPRPRYTKAAKIVRWVSGAVFGLSVLCLLADPHWYGVWVLVPSLAVPAAAFVLATALGKQK